MESRNILIGVTGSVAAIKIGEIVDKLLNDTTFKFEVSVHFERRFQLFKASSKKKNSNFGFKLTFSHFLKYSIHFHKFFSNLNTDQNNNNKKCETFHRSQ